MYGVDGFPPGGVAPGPFMQRSVRRTFWLEFAPADGFVLNWPQTLSADKSFSPGSVRRIFRSLIRPTPQLHIYVWHWWFLAGGVAPGSCMQTSVFAALLS